MLLDRIILLFFLLSSFHESYGKNDYDGIKTVLITAKAVKSEIVRDNSHIHADGSFVIAPFTFRVTFDEVRVQQGVVDKYPSPVDFEIDARSDYQILNEDRVFLLVDISSRPNRLLYWGFVENLVCIPERLISEGYEDYYFYFSEESRKKGEKCSFISFYYQPPDAQDEEN
jgi:hypothetical protein